MSSELMAALTFAGVAIMIYFLLQFVYAKKAIKQRIATLGAADPGPVQLRESAASAGDNLPTVTRLLSGTRYTENLMFSLIQAGVKLRPSEFIGLVAGITLTLTILAALMFNSVLVMLLAIVIGIAAPFSYLSVMQHRRVIQFNRQLPDALSLMSSSLRTGYSVLRAMQMVASEMPNPIAEEFQRVINETNVGVPMETALQHLIMRVKSYDLELVVTAITIQQQIGGNLSEILENIAATIRERVKIEGEIDALTAEGRISGIILFVLPFVMAIILTIMNPTYMRTLIVEPVGRVLIVCGLALQIIGGFVIKKMLVLDF